MATSTADPLDRYLHLARLILQGQRQEDQGYTLEQRVAAAILKAEDRGRSEGRLSVIDPIKRALGLL